MTTIVLTGSQSGMGWVMRQHLESQPDTRVIGVDLPGKGAEVEADLSSSAGCQAAVDQVLLQAGDGLSGVVANAGVDANDPALTFGVNYFGVVDFLQGLQPALAQAAPTSVVVNVSNSIAITPHIPLAPVEALMAGDRGPHFGSSGMPHQHNQHRIAYATQATAQGQPVQLGLHHIQQHPMVDKGLE